MMNLLAIIGYARVAFGLGLSGVKLAARFVAWLHGPSSHTVLHWLSPADLLKIVSALLFYGSGLAGFAAMVGTETAAMFSAIATALLVSSQALTRLLAGPAAAPAAPGV